MHIPFNDLGRLHKKDAKDFEDAFRRHLNSSDFILGNGVKRFEEAFANLHNIEHCISCSNGTTALFLAIKSLELSMGDEVIVPANTWISSSAAVSNANAVPVFCDVEEDTFNLSVDSLQEKITERTRAIIAVHMFGLPADMDKILSICNERGLFLIEDCAQAHFATIFSEKVGTFGDISTFSFFPGKILGAFGDGGAVLTKNSLLANRCRVLARNGSRNRLYFEMEGVNSRLDSLQASILNIKLERIQDCLSSRKKIARRFNVEFCGIGDLILPPIVIEGRESSINYYVIRTKFRNALLKYLAGSNIKTQIHYPCALPFQDAYKHFGFIPNDFPIAFKLQSEILSLPFYPFMEEEEIIYLKDNLNKFFDKTEHKKTRHGI